MGKRLIIIIVCTLFILSGLDMDMGLDMGSNLELDSDLGAGVKLDRSSRLE